MPRYKNEKKMAGIRMKGYHMKIGVVEERRRYPRM